MSGPDDAKRREAEREVEASFYMTGFSDAQSFNPGMIAIDWAIEIGQTVASMGLGSLFRGTFQGFWKNLLDELVIETLISGTAKVVAYSVWAAIDDALGYSSYLEMADDPYGKWIGIAIDVFAEQIGEALADVQITSKDIRIRGFNGGKPFRVASLTAQQRVDATLALLADPAIRTRQVLSARSDQLKAAKALGLDVAAFQASASRSKEALVDHATSRVSATEFVDKEATAKANEQAPVIAQWIFKHGIYGKKDFTVAELYAEVEAFYREIDYVAADGTTKPVLPEGRSIRGEARLGSGEWVTLESLEAVGYSYQDIMTHPFITEIQWVDPASTYTKSQLREMMARGREWKSPKYKVQEKEQGLAAAVQEFTTDLHFEKGEDKRFMALSNMKGASGVLKVPVGAIESVITAHFDRVDGKLVFKHSPGTKVECPIYGVDFTINTRADLDQFLARYDIYLVPEAGTKAGEGALRGVGFAFLGTTAAEAKKLTWWRPQNEHLKKYEVHLFDQHALCTPVDYSSGRFDEAYGFLSDELSAQAKATFGKVPIAMGTLAKAVLQRLDSDPYHVSKYSFSKTVTMHPAFMASKSRAGYGTTIQGAVGEVLALLSRYELDKGKAEDFLDDEFGPAVDTWLDANVESPLLSVPGKKTQAFDYFVTRRRVLDGAMVYSIVKAGEVKTYKQIHTPGEARRAISSVVRAITHGLFLAQDPAAPLLKAADGTPVTMVADAVGPDGNKISVPVHALDGSGRPMHSMELAVVGDALTKYLDDNGGKLVDIMAGADGKDGRRQGWINAGSRPSGIFVAGVERVDGLPGRWLVIPQVDLVDEPGKKTPVIMIEQADGMVAVPSTGTATTTYNIKAGLVANENIKVLYDGETGTLTPGGVFFKRKNGADFLQPMVVGTDGTLQPNPAFWDTFGKADVNVFWDLVVYDSFHADPAHRAKPIPLNVVEIGYGIDYESVSYTYPDSITSKVMDLLFHVHTVPTALQKLFAHFSSKMHARKLRDRKGTGGIIDREVVGMNMNLMNPIKGVVGRSEKYERAVESQLRKDKRTFAQLFMIELLLHERLGIKAVEGDIVPYRAIDRLFPAYGWDENEDGSRTLVRRPDGTPNSMAQQGIYNANTLSIDLQKMEILSGSVKANDDVVNVNILARKHVGDKVWQRFFNKRLAAARVWMEKNKGSADLHAEMITGAHLNEWLNARTTGDMLSLLSPAAQKVWATADVPGKMALIQQYGVITADMQARMIDELQAVSKLVSSIPGARAIDVAGVSSAIQAFINLVNQKMANKVPIYYGSTTGIGYVVMHPIHDQLDALLNAWREIWRVALASISKDPAWQRFVRDHFHPVVRSSQDILVDFQEQSMTETRRRALAWLAGLMDSSWGGRDLVEHLMFPEFTRSFAAESFELLVLQNRDDIEDGQAWQVARSPILHSDGKYYFEIRLYDTQGTFVPGTSRVGYFAADSVYPNDPAQAGVTFYVDATQQPSWTADQLFSIDEDGVVQVSPPAAGTAAVRHGVHGFWDTVPR